MRTLGYERWSTLVTLHSRWGSYDKDTRVLIERWRIENPIPHHMTIVAPRKRYQA